MSDLWDSLGATEGTTRHASIGGFQIKPHDHWSRLGRVQAMLRTASDPYDGGKTITRAQYDSMVPHEYAGTGTPLHPDEDGYWAMYLGDGGTTLVTGLELVEADYPLSADLPSHQGGKDDTVDWDARKMRSEPSDPEGQPAEQKEKEPVKWLESSKTAATYEVRPVIERGGEWQPAGEELAEAEEVMKGLYDRTGDFHLVLLRNNFNGGVYVYQVDSPIFNARPFPMGTYEDFYGAPFHDSRTAAVGDSARHLGKTAMPAPADLGVAVGDIFVNSWGYDQTNVNYYKVIRLTGQGVEIVPIGKKFVSQNGPGGNSVVPDPDNVLDRDVCTGIGIAWDDGADKKSKVCKLKDGYRGTPSIVLRSGQYWASKWDGQPEHETDSMFGH